MKTIQHVLFLLPVLLLSSCFTNRIAYKQMESIRRGMSAEEVIAILGEPSYRSFNDKGEMLEFGKRNTERPKLSRCGLSMKKRLR